MSAAAPVPARPLTSAATVLWLIVVASAAIVAALVEGGLGSPRFTVGLAFGVAVGAVPYFLVFAVDFCRPLFSSTPRRRRHRLSAEEWRRLFETPPGASAGGATFWSSTSDHVGGGRAGIDAAVEGRQAVLEAYQILGLAPDAPARDVRVAYHRLAHRYHPDKVAAAPDDAQRLAETRMKELNAAYAVLRRAHRNSA